MLPNKFNPQQQSINQLNSNNNSENNNNNSSTTANNNNTSSPSYTVGSSIMNSNNNLHHSIFQKPTTSSEEEENDINLDETDLGESSQIFEDDEINFDDDNSSNSGTNNNIIVKKEAVDHNYYEASQVLDEEETEEINFDDEVTVEINEKLPSLLPTSIVTAAADTTITDNDNDEEINFDDPIILVNSDDESIDLDDEAPSLSSIIKVKVEPGISSHNSSVSVNMDEMDNNTMMHQDDEDLNEHVNNENAPHGNSNNQTINTTTTVNLISEPPSSSAVVVQQQKSLETDDLIIEDDLDFDMDLTSDETSSLQPLPNIKLAGTSSQSLITQPSMTMESIQPPLPPSSLLTTPNNNIDSSSLLILPPSPPPQPESCSPTPLLTTSIAAVAAELVGAVAVEEELLPPPSSTISSSLITTNNNSQPNTMITQELIHTPSSSASRSMITQELISHSQHYKIKQEKIISSNNTLQDAICISSDDSDDEVMVDHDNRIIVPSSLPSIIEESDHEGEISSDDDQEEIENEELADEEESEYSSSSSEEDEEIIESDAVSTSSGRFKPSLSVKRLATAFRMITKDICTGTFCCGGPMLTRVGLPGLQLIIPSETPNTEPKLKCVTFPLVNPEQAKEIIKLSKRVSKSSNEYYLNTDQFVITNPGWNEMVAELINQCTRGNLGVNPEKDVSFQLYQLVLFKEGENRRRRNALPSNVFAQFIVQLPCSYKGGKTKFSFREEKLEYDFSTNSSYIPSYVTYFTECENEEESIEDGYKLYLIYNLIYDGKPSFKPSLETVHKVAENLKKIETLWSPQETPFAVYLLDSVKESECRVDLLKGQDVVLYNFITLFNNQFPLFDIYLGLFERTIIRNTPTTNNTASKKPVTTDDEIYDSDDECSYLVKRLTNPKTGIVLSQMFKIELSDTIPYESAISSSNRNCLVIIPKKYHYNSLKYMDAKTCYEGFISLFKECTTDPSKKELCIELAYSQTQSQFFKGKLFDLIPILLQLGDVELFKKFITPIPILDLPTWNSIIECFGITPLRAELLLGLVGFVCCKSTDLERRANQTFNYLTSQLQDEQLSLEFMNKLLEKIDNLTNSVNSGILSITFLVSLINTCSKLKIEGETVGKIALKIIQTSPIESCTDHIAQILKSLFSQNQVALCNQIFEMILKRSQPQSFDKMMPLVISCLSLLGINNTKSRIVEFCNKMINIGTVVSALQIIETSVQKNDEKLLYLAKYFRKGVINCLQNSQITLQLCQKVLGVLYRAGFKDDISTITSIIIGKSGMIENSIHELLVPLVKWADKDLGKHAFLNPGFNSILQYCINMLKMSLGSVIEDDWSLNVNVGCNCEYCIALSAFLRDKTKRKFEFRRAEAQRNHVTLSAKAVAEKYLAFSVLKNGSPHSLIIEKKSTPNDAEKRRQMGLKEVFDYLTRLSSTVLSLNNPSAMTSSSSSSSINSTTSAKRAYPSSSDASDASDMVRRINKRSK